MKSRTFGTNYIHTTLYWHDVIYEWPLSTEGCMGEEVLLEFDLTFGDVMLHKLVQVINLTC